MFSLFKKKEKPVASMIYHNSFRLAGVTFENDDGSSRQKILGNMKDSELVKLKEYSFENKTAIGVYTEDEKQIGNIKEKDIPFVLERLKTVIKTEIFNLRSFYSEELNAQIITGDVIIYYK